VPIIAGPSTPVDLSTPVGQVRLLINDTNTDDPVFSDAEITAFLTMEGDVVKLAAAQALDTIADDEALTSKVIATQDVRTDGAKLADALRKRAEALREQVYGDDDYFDLIDLGGQVPVPELTEAPMTQPWP
jgi:hypothetical protein